LELKRNFFFIGNKNGLILTYQLENYDEKIIPQSYLKNTSSIIIKRKSEIRSDQNLKVNGIKLTHKNELLVAYSNGSVGIFTHSESYPECK
jgi:hypothetical protein